MSKTKVTLAIDWQLIDEVDHFATASKTNRSNVVENILNEWRARRLEREMAEGYKAMSEENLSVAEESFGAGAEVLK